MAGKPRAARAIAPAASSPIFGNEGGPPSPQRQPPACPAIKTNTGTYRQCKPVRCVRHRARTVITSVVTIGGVASIAVPSPHRLTEVESGIPPVDPRAKARRLPSASLPAVPGRVSMSPRLRCQTPLPATRVATRSRPGAHPLVALAVPRSHVSVTTRHAPPHDAIDQRNCPFERFAYSVRAVRPDRLHRGVRFVNT